jgi:hypothetical protein
MLFLETTLEAQRYIQQTDLKESMQLTAKYFCQNTIINGVMS